MYPLSLSLYIYIYIYIKDVYKKISITAIYLSLSLYIYRYIDIYIYIYMCVFVCVCVFEGEISSVCGCGVVCWKRRRLRYKCNKARMMLLAGGHVPTVEQRPTEATNREQNKAGARDVTLPANWESLPLLSTSLIEARTGIIRTYIVAKVQVGKVYVETNGYLTRYTAANTP